MEGMDLGVRGWMIVIGVLLILAVLLDGYRRVRSDRRNRIRMSIKPGNGLDKLFDDEEDTWRSELPNGGARVIGRPAAQTVAPYEDSGEPDDDSFDEGIELGEVRTVATEPAREVRVEKIPSSTPSVVPAAKILEPAVEPAVASSDAALYKPSIIADEPTFPEQMAAQPEAARARPAVALEPEHAKGLAEKVDEVIVINVMSASGQRFHGEALLHILHACDCRFGKMNIFHRYEEAGARGSVQFSIANAVKPGYFDLDNMASFSTPGISFFMQLPGPKDPVQAFEFMYETAQCVAKNLGGELRDEIRNLMRPQTLEHCRQQIREYERKRLAQRA